MKRKPIIFLLMTLVIGVYIFFEAPNLNPMYGDGAFFWLVIISAYTLVATVTSFKFNQYVDANGNQAVNFDKSKLPPKWVMILLGVLWGLFILVQIIFTPLFFAKTYRDQLDTPVVKEFTTDVQAVDLKQIPVVDKDLAKTLADKKLGEKPSLGSQVVLGEPTIQNVDGELIWAVPLQHSGFFKWLANMEGSAGYIKVSATNLKDVEYVEDYKIKIQPNSYFMYDLGRAARFGGGIFTGLTDYSFELDDDGVPYWVVTTYHNKIGFALPEADGVILVNAQNGETSKYSIDNAPDWVDRVQPEEFLLQQINNQGEYVHGIFNFSNKEKFKTSRGYNIVYNNDKCYFFTGITSVGIDESATGFMMIDMVTKEPILYRMSGATEVSAMSSAQGKVQDLGYQATFPIILNIFEEPTYFMTLKDSAKLIKKYAFVSVKDYMIVGVGDTMTEAKADYAKAIKDITNKVDFVDDNIGILDVVGIIDRINFTIVGEDTIYFFTLEETPGIIYQATLNSSNELPLTQKGDKVSIEYQKDEISPIASIKKFDNQTL